MKISRREFLQGSASLAAMTAMGPALHHVAAQAPAPRGPNERINVAVIGVRSRGREHVGGLAGKHNCVVTHLCDVDTAVIGSAMKSAEAAQKVRPIFEQDLRKILDNKEIHAVSIATPNHWHALAAIWAMQAGKDVYVEKPISHNVWEGRRIVDAVEHYNKICQAGTQIRSMQGAKDAIAFIRSGKLGKVVVARGLCYKSRTTIGKTDGPQKVPDTIDYNLWCGPASNAPPRRNGKFGPIHYDWHWIWEYGNGDLGNQGIHQVDVARWALGKDTLANSCVSVGGRFGYVDDGETANTQIALFDYGEAELLFEVRGLPTKPHMGAMVGNVIHCENGYVVFDRYDRATAFNKGGEKLQEFTGGGDHFGNWLSAVRSRRKQDQAGPALDGHLSSALCHLANVSHRLGTQVAFTPRTSAFGSSASANEALGRMEDHLRNSNVNLASDRVTIGRKLNVDVKTETFRDDAQANRHLTREYRKGFEVPVRF